MYLQKILVSDFIVFSQSLPLSTIPHTKKKNVYNVLHFCSITDVINTWLSFKLTNWDVWPTKIDRIKAVHIERLDSPQMWDRKTTNYSLSKHKAAIDSWGTRSDLSPPPPPRPSILCNHTADVRKPRTNYEVIRLNLIRRTVICIDWFLQTLRSIGT